LDPIVLAIADDWFAPIAWAAVGIVAAAGCWFAAKPGRSHAMPLRFLTVIAVTWSAVCLAYAAMRPEISFSAYLLRSTLATDVIAAMGALTYVAGMVLFQPGVRQWRRSGAVVAGVTLMGSAFVRAAYQPAMALPVHAPLAALFIATVWRLRAEPLVYLAILGVAVTVVFAARDLLAARSDTPVTAWVTSTAAGVSLAMVLVAALLSLVRRAEFNVKWYRQGFLIVPLVVSSLAAMAAGYVAVWDGTTWHTVWALGVWWAVLLVSAVGLRQPDLLGFSLVGAALAAAAAFAVLGGQEIGGYWGRYPALLLVLALGAAMIAALVAIALRRQPAAWYPRALYLAGAAIAIAALVAEPFDTTALYLGLDLLLAAVVLALAHAHRAPAWVNYLVAGLVTGGVGALAHLGPQTPATVWHHRFIQVMAAGAVAWLLVAVGVREVLKRTASDRMARRQTEPFTVFGLVVTLALAAYLSVQQIKTYAQFMTTGASPTRELLGPFWGLLGWLAVLLAFLVSMWLVRHTARTFLFYCVGILATTYVGLFRHTGDLYGYLICAVAGYGSAHLVVYLYEAKFMDLLSRTCALYRDEGRASTTIFTLAVISCFAAAVLAIFRLNSLDSLLMLWVMAAVFLMWSFLWLRGEMLYPAVLMVTLGVLAIWHNRDHPTAWDAYRLNMNALILVLAAFFWLGIGKWVHRVRGEIFQLSAPARACSVILGVFAMGFVAALAISPTFVSAVWRQPRTVADWALGLSTMALLVLYFAWARFVFERRFYSLMSGATVLLVGLYVGIYVGIRL